MTFIQRVSSVARCLWFGLFSLGATLVPCSQAAPTFWTGPNITWTKSVTTPADLIQPGKVELTRGGREVLYNRILESAATTNSPKGTLWAFGNSITATNFTACTGLTYQTMESFRAIAANNLSALILNKDMFVHLTNNDDTYFSIKFTVWGRFGNGGVSYIRSTAPVFPPTVSITNPISGSVFSSPANVALRAMASVTNGTVTNVEYFASGSSLGKATNAPFAATANNLLPGSYSITAVATASGVSATSTPPVTISVVTPVAVSLTEPRIANDLFSFKYSANPGLRYVVQRASSFTGSNSLDWSAVSTNVASSNPVNYSESLSASGSFYYRVGRLPNP